MKRTTKKSKTQPAITFNQMFAVKSSTIELIGYNHIQKTLCIVFKGGGCYHYSEYLPIDWAGLCNGESTGKYFHANIKGEFDCKKVGNFHLNK